MTKKIIVGGGMQANKSKEWQNIVDRDPDTYTDRGQLARLQDDLYYRCHYNHLGHVYTCICKTHPRHCGRNVICRIEPAGQGPHDWDSLASINVPRDGGDVLWDTDYFEITDKTRDKIGSW